MSDSIRIIGTHQGRTQDDVTVEVDGNAVDYTDRDLKVAAGFDTSHFGATVKRWALDPDRATVTLWKD